MLRQPLHPRLLENHWSQPTPTTAAAGEEQPAAAAGTAERMLTLHLHTFVYGRPAKKRKATSRNTNTATSSSAADGNNIDARAAEAYGAAEAALLAAVVGSDAALAALPVGPSVEGGMQQQQQPEGRLCFGVLLWQRLPGGLMQWPAWIQRKLYVVSGGAEHGASTVVRCMLSVVCMCYAFVRTVYRGAGVEALWTHCIAAAAGRVLARVSTFCRAVLCLSAPVFAGCAAAQPQMFACPMPHLLPSTTTE
jgi:hypothetical protein